MTWTISSETPLYLALCLFGIWAYYRNRLIASGLFLGLAVLTRGDGLVLVVLIAAGPLLTFIRSGRENSKELIDFGKRFGGAFFLALLPWVLYSLAVFESPFPVTFSAKRAQGALPGSESYLLGLSSDI